MALIINESMPKGCCWYDEEGHCIRCFHLLDCEQGTPYDAVRPSDCPIIGEIPDEHGRLVDADKILTESGYNPNMFKPKHTKDNDYQQYDTLMGYEILSIIEDAPTVVEATT